MILQKGFHLLEILIIMGIVSILIALAIPTYTQYIAKIRRLEAETTLEKLAAALEKYHFELNTYQGATLAKLHFAEFIAHDNYHLHIQSASASDYLLTAKPLPTQTQHDIDCGTLAVNSLGEHKALGTESVNHCW